MLDPNSAPAFSLLLQRFFVEYLGSQRAVSPRTIAAYRDTFRLFSPRQRSERRLPTWLWPTSTLG